MGSAISAAVSLRKCGCISHGPHDLLTFNFSSTFPTCSAVIVISVIGSIGILQLLKIGIGPGDSLLETLEKYFSNTFAFSLSASSTHRILTGWILWQISNSFFCF